MVPARPAGPGARRHPLSGGGRLVVQVQPRARKTEVAGRYGDAIRIRLAAPPVDNAANDELVRFLAEALGVARRAVRITSGLTARRKVVAIEGYTAAAAAAKLG